MDLLVIIYSKFSKNKKFKVYGLVRKKFDNDERIITLDEISKNSIFLKKIELIVL